MAHIPIHNETAYTFTEDITQHIIRDAHEHFGGCIGKKGAAYATFFRGVTNVWGVSRSWTAADC
jgi:hypothetical protein